MKLNLNTLSLLGAISNFIFIVLFVYFSFKCNIDFQIIFVFSIIYVPVYFVFIRVIPFKNYDGFFMFVINMVVNFFLSIICVATLYTWEFIIKDLNRLGWIDALTEFIQGLLLSPFIVTTVSKHLIIFMLGLAILNTFWLMQANRLRLKL